MVAMAYFMVYMTISTYGGDRVIISYRKLWHLLLDKGMNKKDLRHKAGISTASIAKLGKGENITTDILVRICEVLDCDITDIMELKADTHNDDVDRWI